MTNKKIGNRQKQNRKIKTINAKNIRCHPLRPFSFSNMFIYLIGTFLQVPRTLSSLPCVNDVTTRSIESAVKSIKN